VRVGWQFGGELRKERVHRGGAHVWHDQSGGLVGQTPLNTYR
jgi:hypothetical protein